MPSFVLFLFLSLYLPALYSQLCSSSFITTHNIHNTDLLTPPPSSRGDKIIYSGPGSNTNKDPHNLPDAQGMTKVLRQSVCSGNPVRVLRSATTTAMKHKPSGLAPSVGIRYDGLYRVQSQLQSQHNALGGLYCRFVLVRLPDQEPLADVAARSPTRREEAEWARIWDLW